MDYGDGQTQSYAFDAMGNRTQRVDSVAGTTTYAFDSANRLTTVGAASYTNDADGNTLTGGGRTNAWDAQNRLVSSIVNGTSSAFTYGADGLRRSGTVTPSGGSPTTTRYAYDGQTMVRSLRQNGQGAWQAAATYLTGPRGMEYRRDDLAGTVRWYVYDGLGSVVGELDPSGNLTAGKKYDVYGAERSGGTGASTSRQGYVGSLGHIADAETGLVYMRARYYDPNLGRFVSQDPVLADFNWFIYCGDNPTNFVDESGKQMGMPIAPGTGSAASNGSDVVALALSGLVFLLYAWISCATKMYGGAATTAMAMAGFELLKDAFINEDTAKAGKGAIFAALAGAVGFKIAEKFPLPSVGGALLAMSIYYTICDIYSDSITGS